MCGIIAVVQRVPVRANELLTRLQRLAYRGYDSYGYAFSDATRKGIGHIAIMPDDAVVSGTVAIAHTRWATHGGVTVQNAHPHRSGGTTLVHNGIIDNYETIAQTGMWLSETDSERLAARIDAEVSVDTPLNGLRAALASARGIWAIAAMVEGVDGLLIARKHVPLVIGKTKTGFVVASDARAIADAPEIIALDDGTVALVTTNGIDLQDMHGNALALRWERNTVEDEERPVEGYAMEHEILQIPALLSHAISRAATPIVGEVTIIGCGSSVHAAGIAVALARSRSRVQLASEYNPSLDDAQTLIAVSQSGETADVLDAVRTAKAAGRRVIALVNAPHTTLTRLADTTILLGAGEERCVAATKSVILQIVAIAGILGADVLNAARMGAQRAILDRERIRAHARDIVHAQHVFLIGRGAWLAVAQEAALKLKEIPYQHAEAVPALELKHGPLALITPEVPVIALGDEDDVRLHSTIHEVTARAGRVLPLLYEAGPAGVFCALISLQLLAFEIALLRGVSIDHPRNLAKSVTVY